MINCEEFVPFSYLSNLSIRGSEPDANELDMVRRQYRAMGSSRTMELATKAKMQPFLAKLLLTAGCDQAQWLPILTRYADRNAAVLEELDRVYAAFAAQGVQKAFLSENFGAMLAGGRDQGLFCSGDVDNYADISEYEKVDAAFASLGYMKKERRAGKLLISADYAGGGRLPDGFAIGIEFFSLSRLWLPCLIEADRFVDWSRLRKFGDSAVMLPPADALMYICLLHISMHSFCRAPAIRLYRDIVNACIGMTEDDWRRISAWASDDGMRRRIATAATLSNRIAATSIPDYICNLAGGDNEKLLTLAYDDQNSVLRPEPSRMDVKRIEAACYDGGAIRGIGEILAPNRAWMKAVYGGAGAAAYLKHFTQLF